MEGIPWWYELLAPAFGDPGGVVGGLAESERRVERMRAYDHYKELAGKYLPDQNPAHVAHALDTFDPENPEHRAIQASLDAAMGSAAQGHVRGISPSERKALGGNEVMPDYLLGPGDQKVYGVLRDSNLVNAAMGRTPVQDPRMLATQGKTFSGAKPAWSFGGSSAHPMNKAVQDFEAAAADPTRHSSFTRSYYPQHQLLTHDATTGSFARGGDTITGQTMGTFAGFSDGSRGASRRDDDNYGTPVDALDRWMKNLGGQIGDQLQVQWADQATNRASPLVPDSFSDGKPLGAESRQDYIDSVMDLGSRSKPPSIEEHAASQGKTVSPAWGWLQDFGHEFVDPVTPGMAAVSGPLAFGRTLAKGGGPLRGLLNGATAATYGEAVSEAAEPINWGMGLMSFPYDKGMAAFAAPKLEEMPGDLGQPGYRDKYKAEQNQRDQRIRRIREAREMIGGD